MSSTLLFVPSIPSHFNREMFLDFCGDVVTKGCVSFIENSRQIDKTYSVLMYFKEQHDARSLIAHVKDRSYMELEIGQCHIFPLDHVDYQVVSDVFSFPPPPTQGYVELPTCVVCLERLDQTMNSISEVKCGHEFNCACLGEMTGLSCQVCNIFYRQYDWREVPTCSICDDAVIEWVCLLCSFRGCGSYTCDNGSCTNHVRRSNHSFFLEYKDLRIWNMEAMRYVHRLMTPVPPPSWDVDTSADTNQGKTGGV